jgi:threonine/homoserine/homoserine lactone efflux protein
MSGPDRGLQPISLLTVLMIGIGAVLLFPGLCTLYVMAGAIISGDLVRLVTRDKLVLSLWVVSLLIALGGALLIWLAWRRERMRRS